MTSTYSSTCRLLLPQLPDELILRIFSFLEYDKLLKLAQVSKHINLVSNDPELWKHLFELDLDMLPFVQNTTLTLNKPSIHRRINTAMTWKGFYYESYFKQRIKGNPPLHDPSTRHVSTETAALSRMQRSRILYIGPKKSGKSTLFYHLRFGTSFKGIYYLRKFGTVVQIDLALANKSKKSLSSSSSSSSSLSSSLSSLSSLSSSSSSSSTPSSSSAGSSTFPISHHHEPHGVDILPADLEVHDVEDFEALPFKRNVLPDGVVIVVNSTALSDPGIICHLTSLLSSPHIGAETVPVLVLATRADEEGAMKAAGVARTLGVWDMPGRPWRVQSCSAISLFGVREGLLWLHTEMKDRKSWES